MKNEFTIKVREKGWTLKELSTIWEIPEGSLKRIAANPKKIHWELLKTIKNRKEDH